MRLLLVEDDSTTRRMMERLLQKEGYRVTSCPDAETALECHDREPFPFIMVDLLLPGIDGPEFAHRVRARPDGDHPFILAMTASDCPGRLSESLSSGANDYIVKPVSVELLRVRLAVAESRISEIAARKALERKNQASQAYIENIIRSIPDMLLVIDGEGGIARINQPVVELLGYPPEELIGKPADIVFQNGSTESILFDGLGATGSEGNIETTMLAKDGQRIPILLSRAQMSDASDEGSQGIVCVAKDIRERLRAEEQIRNLAFYDSLTGLPNRRLMRDRLESALQAAKRNGRLLGILFLDLDGFKRVNDTLGHSTGDRLLCKVGERLSENVRLRDVVGSGAPEPPQGSISRFGGDEFIVLLASVSEAQDAEDVAARLVKDLSRPFQIEGEELFVTTSIGIAVFPRDGEDADALLRKADTAMYHSKESGRNTYRHYAPHMDTATSTALRLVGELHHALQRGEFTVHYQPVRDAGSGRLTAAEALVRWNHPRRGLVLPDEFLPAAEEAGLMGAIDRWVLRTACATDRQWRTAGPRPIRMSVNLSAHRMKEPELVRTVSQVLRETGMSPARLELEINENAILQGDDPAVASLEKLAGMGIGLALNGFGTGYSSLSDLLRLPIDRVKIDRAFVARITTDPDAARFVAAIVSMAHHLGLKVVAEGVETLQQAELLRGHGCDELQGFLFSPALPREEFAQLLQQEKNGTPGLDGA